MGDKAKSYDDNFIDNNPPPTTPIFDIFDNIKETSTSFNSELLDYGQDINNNEYLPDNYDWFNANDTREDRAEFQSGWSKAGNGVSRVLNGFVMNIAEMPGYLGGGIAALGNEAFGDGEGSMDMFVNNSWINAIEKEKDWFNNEVLPVYVKDSVRNGNLWDNISSIDFWATEGADGVAFMAAALAPGYGLKGLGKLTKLSQALQKTKRGTQIFDAMTSAFESAGLQGAVNGIDVVNATLANTVYEAGVEARGTGEGFIRNNKDKIGTIVNGKLYTQEQFDTDRTDAMRNTFLANSALLLVPNAIMSKALLGKGVTKVGNQAFKEAGGVITSEVEDFATKRTLKGGLKTVAEMTASEGFLEEAGQNTIQAKFDGSSKKSWGETYLDVIGSTEGQKAIFLGGLFGSVMQGATFNKNEKAEKEDYDRQVKEYDRQATSMTEKIPVFNRITGNVYKTDKDGAVQYDENDKPIINAKKVAELGKTTDWFEQQFEQKQIAEDAAKEGFKDAEIASKIIDTRISNASLFPFIQAGKDGISILKEHLSNGIGLDAHIAKINEGREEENKITKDSFIEKKISEAKEQLKDYEFFAKYGKFENKTSKLKDNNTLKEFRAHQLANYTNNKSSIRVLDNIINEDNQALSKLEELHYKRYKFTQEQKDNPKLGGKKILALRDKIKFTEATRDEFLADIDNILDIDKSKKEYESLVRKNKKLAEDEANEAEFTDFISKINNSTSKKDLEKLKDDKIYSKRKDYFDREINKRKLEIDKATAKDNIKRKETVVAKKEEEAEKRETTNEEIEYINSNFNEGEDLPSFQFEHTAISAKDRSEVKLDKDSDYILASKTISNGKPSIIVTKFDTGEQFLIMQKSEPVQPTTEPIYESDGEGIHSNANEKSVVDFEEKVEKDYENQQKAGINTKVMSTIEDTDELLPSLEDSIILEYERNGVVKKGDEVSFKIGDEIPQDKLELNSNYANANMARTLLEQAKNGEKLSPEDLKILYYYLPIKMLFNGSDNIYSYVMPKPNPEHSENSEKAEAAAAIFEHRELPLRESIISKLIEGKDINNIKTVITEQFGGKLQVEAFDKIENKDVENNVLDLDQINGDVRNVKISMLNEHGKLINTEGKEIPRLATTAKWKGTFWITVTKPNGQTMNIKLNNGKVKESKAKLLYALYKEMVNNQDLSETSRLSDLQAIVDPKTGKLSVNPNMKKMFQALAKEELEIFAKLGGRSGTKYEDVTIGELIELITYKGSDNPKTRLRLERGTLVFGNNRITLNEFNNDSKEDEFINWMTTFKNANTIFKSRPGSINPRLNASSDIYLEYLLKNKILNTNVKVKQPLFTGFTNMYVNNQAFVKGNKTSKLEEVKDIPTSKLEIIPQTSTIENEKYKVSRTYNKYGAIEDRIIDKITGNGIFQLTTKKGISYAGIGQHIDNAKPMLNDISLKKLLSDNIPKKDIKESENTVEIKKKDVSLQKRKRRTRPSKPVELSADAFKSINKSNSTTPKESTKVTKKVSKITKKAIPDNTTGTIETKKDCE